ncbi:hypothetical protein [Aquabacterium sp. CECT 9606]|uniref:hypothetical protein n=1 Tax=Aquabacterium sp. CECT 9606 TaxID=2845822 RepID=UPI001E484E51|nr:hypothetical protein [Aquabacterium sp. CECT 9606]
MSRTSKFAAWGLAAAILMVLALVLVHETDCCEKSDPQVKSLLALAEQGDLLAIRELYVKASSDGVTPMVEHWALEGAIRGDPKLREDFILLFGRMDVGRKGQLLSVLRRRTDQPGTACLLTLLESPGAPMGDHCLENTTQKRVGNGKI